MCSRCSISLISSFLFSGAEVFTISTRAFEVASRLADAFSKRRKNFFSCGIKKPRRFAMFILPNFYIRFLRKERPLVHPDDKLFQVIFGFSFTSVIEPKRTQH